MGAEGAENPITYKKIVKKDKKDLASGGIRTHAHWRGLRPERSTLTSRSRLPLFRVMGFWQKRNKTLEQRNVLIHSRKNYLLSLKWRMSYSRSKMFAENFFVAIFGCFFLDSKLKIELCFILMSLCVFSTHLPFVTYSADNLIFRISPDFFMKSFHFGKS